MSKIKSFGEIFDSVYAKPEKKYGEILLGEMGEIKKSFTTGLGHPEYQAVQFGEIVPGTLIVFFIDIRGFTKLAIALDNEELIKILQAITIASIYSIRQFGGYVAEFTGDGVMAFFGGRSSVTATDALCSLKASASMMQGIKETVNKHLNSTVDETVRVGMGLEFGNVLWTRLGIDGTSQVKPVSEISFVAGKNSGQAKSWEIIIGKNLAEWVPDEFKEKYPAYLFQKDGRTYEYARYLLKWQSFNSAYNSNASQLEQRLLKKTLPVLPMVVLSSNGTLTSVSSTKQSGGPRPLKDQPFF
ncbi:MAG: adenylate/guanylate cyclase domain-containing protein [Bacillota bacterium]